MVLGRRNATVPAQYEIDVAVEEANGRLQQEVVGKSTNKIVLIFWGFE